MNLLNLLQQLEQVKEKQDQLAQAQTNLREAWEQQPSDKRWAFMSRHLETLGFTGGGWIPDIYAHFPSLVDVEGDIIKDVKIDCIAEYLDCYEIQRYATVTLADIIDWLDDNLDWNPDWFEGDEWKKHYMWREVSGEPQGEWKPNFRLIIPYDEELLEACKAQWRKELMENPFSEFVVDW